MIATYLVWANGNIDAVDMIAYMHMDNLANAGGKTALGRHRTSQLHREFIRSYSIPIWRLDHAMSSLQPV